MSNRKISHSWIAFAVAVLLISVIGAATAQGETFEGIVHFRLSLEGAPQSMRYFLKPGYQRVETGEGKDQTVVVFDMKAKKALVLMVSEKMYIEEPLKLPTSDSTSAEAKRTGRKLTIAGHACEQWTVRDSAGEHEVCLNDELGGFVSMNAAMRDKGPPSVFERLLVKRFPLRLVTNGKVQYETIKIEPRKLEDALFKLPAGFTKMSLP